MTSSPSSETRCWRAVAVAQLDERRVVALGGEPRLQLGRRRAVTCGPVGHDGHSTDLTSGAPARALESRPMSDHDFRSPRRALGRLRRPRPTTERRRPVGQRSSQQARATRTTAITRSPWPPPSATTSCCASSQPDTDPRRRRPQTTRATSTTTPARGCRAEPRGRAALGARAKTTSTTTARRRPASTRRCRTPSTCVARPGTRSPTRDTPPRAWAGRSPTPCCAGTWSRSGRLAPDEPLSARHVWMAAKETDQRMDYPSTFLEEDGTSLKAGLDVVRKFGAVLESELPWSGSLAGGAPEAYYRVGASRAAHGLLQPRRRQRRRPPRALPRVAALAAPERPGAGADRARPPHRHRAQLDRSTPTRRRAATPPRCSATAPTTSCCARAGARAGATAATRR